MELDAAEPTRVSWKGPVKIDGKLWPVQDANSVLAPPGKHRLSAATDTPALTVTDFNGDIRSAVASGNGVELSYTSRSRAVALLGSPIAKVEVDGAPFSCQDGRSILLPAGQHIVTFIR